MTTTISATSLVAPTEIISTNSRVQGIDALRGAAALMVMLFHYTTRYQMKFGHSDVPTFSLPWGYQGIYLFFMISGFVIFMTLERTSRPMDFVVSRFSRLYPAYWVAAAVTFATLSMFSELGKEVSVAQALGNLLMFHELFGIAHLDGVYWTLEVELLFYWIMFMLWLTSWFQKPVRWIGAWLLICIASELAKPLGFTFPYIASRILILPYFPYFALGILLYIHFRQRRFRWSVEGILGALAMLAIGLNSYIHALWACGILAVIWAVGFRFGSSPPVLALAKFGAISYPLYLLHETIGWTVIHRMEQMGVSSNLSIGFTCIAAIALATAMHFIIEKPAMLAIRKWRASTITTSPANPLDVERWKWIVGLLMLGIVIVTGNRLTLHS